MALALPLQGELWSHATASLIKPVPFEDRFHILSRSGEIDVFQESFHRNISGGVSAAPSLGPAGAGIVLSEREGERIGLGLPVLQSPVQIPGPGMKIYFGIKELFVGKIVNPLFARPFVSCFLAHLH